MDLFFWSLVGFTIFVVCFAIWVFWPRTTSEGATDATTEDATLVAQPEVGAGELPADAETPAAKKKAASRKKVSVDILCSGTKADGSPCKIKVKKVGDRCRYHPKTKKASAK